MLDLKLHRVEAFAICVDINGFTKIVEAEATGTISDMIRDTLIGSVRAIEKCGGDVFAFAGDAIVGALPDAYSAYAACCKIARDINGVCEYISDAQKENPDVWPELFGGPTVKIGVERGAMHISSISSRLLGTQPLVIGEPINYAFRILRAPLKGNRCLVGPRAVEGGLGEFGAYGPHKTKGKTGETDYEFYRLPLSEEWLDGPRRKGRRSYISR